MCSLTMVCDFSAAQVPLTTSSSASSRIPLSMSLCYNAFSLQWLSLLVIITLRFFLLWMSSAFKYILDIAIMESTFLKLSSTIWRNKFQWKLVIHQRKMNILFIGNGTTMLSLLWISKVEEESNWGNHIPIFWLGS